MMPRYFIDPKDGATVVDSDGKVVAYGVGWSFTDAKISAQRIVDALNADEPEPWNMQMVAPRPWKADGLKFRDASNRYLGEVCGNTTSNVDDERISAEIVRAMNSQELLVAALENIRKVATQGTVITIANEALDRLGGKAQP